MVVSDEISSDCAYKEALKLHKAHTQNPNTNFLPAHFSKRCCYLIKTWSSDTVPLNPFFCHISTILAISSACSNTPTIWSCKFCVSFDFLTMWWNFNCFFFLLLLQPPVFCGVPGSALCLCLWNTVHSKGSVHSVTYHDVVGSDLPRATCKLYIDVLCPTSDILNIQQNVLRLLGWYVILILLLWPIPGSYLSWSFAEVKLCIQPSFSPGYASVLVWRHVMHTDQYRYPGLHLPSFACNS